MNIENIFSIIERLENSTVTKLEIKDGDFKLSLEKGYSTVMQPPAVAPVSVVTGLEKITASDNQPQKPEISGNIVCAPIVGTFYASPEPDKPPFVSVGQRVKKGDVICIIEAMKLFNEIQSDYDGVIKEIFPQNGELLEYGQPVMVIE